MIKYQILILLISLGVVGCKDDPTPNCNDFPHMDISWFSHERFQYKTPYCNPNNSNEFVYNFFDYESAEFKLMKYDIGSKTKTELADNVYIITQPRWSRKGWIAFDNMKDPGSYQIWIVKENGDSLTQRSQSLANLYPVWNSDGNELYWNHSPVLGIPYYFVKQDINTSVLDTVLENGDPYNGYAGSNDVSSNNKLLSRTSINNTNHIGIADLNSSTISFSSLVNLEAIYNMDRPDGLCWSSDGQYAFYTFNGVGLFKINTSNGQIVKLMTFCDSKRYTSLSSSSDGKYLVAERVDAHLEHNANGGTTGKIIENSSIYLIDISTLEEIKVEL